MMQKFQRFGSAMFVPVLFFAFSGIVIGFASLFTNELIVGEIAKDGTTWMKIWNIIETGAWTIFNQMPLIFAMGIPLTLARKANGRAVVESVILFLTFNYFTNAFITQFPDFFNINLDNFVEEASGITVVAGVLTLDTSILGAILISSISTWIHNKYFDKSLPDYLGIFQGSALVVIIGFFIMIPVAFLIALVWPIIQNWIISLQKFMATSGSIGVWVYIFLEKLLLPTGLHHFIYGPFQYGPAVVDGGTYAYWLEHISQFAQSSKPLIELFPQGGFALQGNSNIFGLPAAALAMYSCADRENKKKVAGLLIPATFTAIIAGITEPLEFTYIFVSPFLFAIKALLDATMATTMYLFGVTGTFGGGLLEFLSLNWIPLFNSHGNTYIKQILIGLIFVFIYYFVFKTLILKLDIKTPGRSGKDTKLYNKDDVRTKIYHDENSKAINYIDLLGGKENISNLTNCATRLRVQVNDVNMVADDEDFKTLGATGVVRNNNALQIIIGLSVQNLKEEISEELGKGE